MAMNSCIVGHVAQQFCDHYKSRPASSIDDRPVRRPEHSETKLTYTSRSSEQREFTIGRDVGAAYVKIIWLGFLLFLLRLAVAIHHCLSRVVLLFLSAVRRNLFIDKTDEETYSTTKRTARTPFSQFLMKQGQSKCHYSTSLLRAARSSLIFR